MTRDPKEALRLAQRFHEAYERLAPAFGYETRTETREFDPESANGQLMVAVCSEVFAALTPARAEDVKRLVEAIERDEDYDRTYIPMPGGWEVQTKGKGSTFRLVGPDDESLPIPDSPYLHETLEQMARDIHAALSNFSSPAEGDTP
jgi:hypothetical protein